MDTNIYIYIYVYIYIYIYIYICIYITSNSEPVSPPSAGALAGPTAEGHSDREAHAEARPPSCSGRDSVKSLRSSYTGLYPQTADPTPPLCTPHPKHTTLNNQQRTLNNQHRTLHNGISSARSGRSLRLRSARRGMPPLR
jgi:hypothetical protein